MSRNLFVILAVVLQVFVLAFMVGKREMIVRTGQTIWIRTAPIDPRDLFRGAFVRLKYRLNRVIDSELREGLNQRERQTEGDVVYSVLRETENGLVELDYTTDERPESGLFLKGRTTHDGRLTCWGGANLMVKYGIETYFVEQGAGLEIEEKRGVGGGVQVPLEVEVAVGKDGTSIIKGHRWSLLGIGIEILPLPRQSRRAGPPTPPPVGAKLQITLRNASEKPVAIVNLPDLGAFELKSVRWATKQNEVYELVKPLERDVLIENAHVIALEPGESHVYTIDLEDDRWLVRGKGTRDKPVKMATLPWEQIFQFVYAPPAKEACSHLANSAAIWHGHLESQAFHAQGRVD